MRGLFLGRFLGLDGPLGAGLAPAQTGRTAGFGCIHTGLGFCLGLRFGGVLVPVLCRGGGKGIFRMLVFDVIGLLCGLLVTRHNRTDALQLGGDAVTGGFDLGLRRGGNRFGFEVRQLRLRLIQLGLFLGGGFGSLRHEGGDRFLVGGGFGLCVLGDLDFRFGDLGLGRFRLYHGLCLGGRLRDLGFGGSRFLDRLRLFGGRFGGGWRCLGPGRFLGRFRRGGPGQGGRRGLGCAQHETGAFAPGLDLAGDLALGDAGEHLGVGLRRLGAEIPVVGGQIAEILGDRLHGVKRVFESFQRARERAVGNGQHLVTMYHRLLVLFRIIGLT